MRNRIIAGNWKMNKTLDEALDLVKSLSAILTGKIDTEVVVCPPFIDLHAVRGLVDGTPVRLGAQNMHWEEKGAYTGEISAAMLKSVGCEYVILGHSERRQYFGETDLTVNKKIGRALETGLKPIVCVGELLDERKADQTETVVEKQVRGAFDGLTADQLTEVVIAYEPVWAIGTGEVATPEQAQDVHSFIRRLLSAMYDENLAQHVRIQYGGSMKPANAADLLAQPDIDGGLIGGASLDAQSFVGIINA
jgi:triosephosphate isomerase